MKSIYNLLRKPVKVDDLALRKLRERGAHAEALVRDETLSEAFVEVEAAYMGAWRSSDPFDVEARERAHLAVTLLAHLKGQLINFVREGEVAKAKIQREAERGKRAA